MTANNSSAGLRGVSAGTTAIATVGSEGTGLRYRGYDVADLAEHASFEAVAWLLLHGELPAASELQAFRDGLAQQRALPPALREVLERVPGATHPMDVLRTACSMLGTIEPEGDFSRQQDVAMRLIATLPSMLLYWYHFVSNGTRIETAADAPGGLPCSRCRK